MIVLNRESKTPLYQQLSKEMRGRILAGEWRPGQRLAGRNEMAEELGVSSITVVQAVEELMRDGLIVRRRGSGTYVVDPLPEGAVKEPTPAARIHSQRQADTLQIAIVNITRDGDDSYVVPLYTAIHHAVCESGLDIALRPLPWRVLEDADRSGTDGFLVSAIALPHQHLLRRIRAAGIPFVVTGAAYQDRTLPCVAVDNTGGTQAIVRHLMELGHRRIAFIDLCLANPDHEERWRAFEQAMHAAGVAVDSRLLLLRSGPAVTEYFQMEIAPWLDNVPAFTAMVVASHLEATVVLQALRKRRYHIPEQVSFATFDDPPAAEFHTPPLTTVRQPIDGIARRALEKLVEGIRSGRMPEGTEVLPVELIVRGSTGPAAG